MKFLKSGKHCVVFDMCDGSVMKLFSTMHERDVALRNGIELWRYGLGAEILDGGTEFRSMWGFRSEYVDGIEYDEYYDARDYLERGFPCTDLHINNIGKKREKYLLLDTIF